MTKCLHKNTTLKKLLNIPLGRFLISSVYYLCVIRAIMPFMYSPSLYRCINYGIDSI